MAQELYFSGSIYQEAPSDTPEARATIERADPNCWYMTKHLGQHAIVSGGRLYLFAGKQPGWKPPHSVRGGWRP